MIIEAAQESIPSRVQNPGTRTFRDQSAIFLATLAQRKRNPVSAATLATWHSIIRTHILPRIGTQEVENFENLQLKQFADAMHAEGMNPKLIHYAVQIVKRIIREPRDSNGMRLYVREWDSEFLDLPTIPKTETYVPSAEKLKQAIRGSSKNETLQALIVFCAGTGLRIGEALACRIGPDKGTQTTWDANRLSSKFDVPE